MSSNIDRLKNLKDKLTSLVSRETSPPEKINYISRLKRNFNTGFSAPLYATSLHGSTCSASIKIVYSAKQVSYGFAIKEILKQSASVLKYRIHNFDPKLANVTIPVSVFYANGIIRIEKGVFSYESSTKKYVLTIANNLTAFEPGVIAISFLLEVKITDMSSTIDAQPVAIPGEVSTGGSGCRSTQPQTLEPQTLETLDHGL